VSPPDRHVASRLERLLWTAVAAYSVAIWGLAYFVQLPLDLLRDRGLLSAVVTAVLLLAAAVAAGAAWRLRPSRAEWLVLVAGGLVFALVASRPSTAGSRRSPTSPWPRSELGVPAGTGAGSSLPAPSC